MNLKKLLTTLAGLGLTAASLLAPCALTAQTRADAEKDPVLKAMLEEMNRSMADLQLKGFAKPFFIEYRIEDVDSFTTKAEFGATEGSFHNRERIARVTVRVGDAKSDSSTRGDGTLELASIENDPLALRSALWDATDQAYKNALAIYAQKQAALKQVQTLPQADDFSQEKPVISLAAPVRLSLDQHAWAQHTAAASGVYRTNPAVAAGQHDIEESNAEFQARATTTYIVNSQGAIVRKTSTEYEESFAVDTQASDGMDLERSYASTGRSLDDLDSPAAFEKREVKEIESLAALRKAPLVEDEYHGPLLLSADAATDTLRSLLGSAVVATRPPLGTEVRTTGPFASSYQARVLPPFLSVIDDPGLKNYEGKGLIGSYQIDDEAVPEQPVDLVRSGRLVNYLIGREPVKGFPQSNGHARAGLTSPPRPSISVLKIAAQNGLTDAQLQQKLMELMKSAGLDHAYYAETLAGAGNPRLLYRVNADGSRQLVRGAELDDIDERALRTSIDAVGKNLLVANYFGDIPQTVIAPALLLSDSTVRRAQQQNQKLPFYPPPQ